MQITAELGNQHLEKLHDPIYKIQDKNHELNEGKLAYQLMLQSGFIGFVEEDEFLSENYRNYLDWSHKI